MEDDLDYKIEDFEDDKTKDFNSGQTKKSQDDGIQQTQSKTVHKRLGSKGYLITSSSSSSQDQAAGPSTSTTKFPKGTLRLSVGEGKYKIFIPRNKDTETKDTKDSIVPMPPPPQPLSLPSNPPSSTKSRSITFTDKKKKKHSTVIKDPSPIKNISSGRITKHSSPAVKKQSRQSVTKQKSISSKLPQSSSQLQSAPKLVFKPLNVIKIEKVKTLSVCNTASSSSSTSSLLTSKKTIPTAIPIPVTQEKVKIEVIDAESNSNSTSGNETLHSRTESIKKPDNNSQEILDDLLNTLTESCNKIQSYLSSGSTSLLNKDVLKKKAKELHCTLKILTDNEDEMTECKAAAKSILVTSTKATNDEGYTIVAGSKVVVTKGILLNQSGTVEGFNDAGRAIIKMDSYSAEDIVSDWYRYLHLSVLRPLTPLPLPSSTPPPPPQTTAHEASTIALPTPITSTCTISPVIMSYPDVKVPVLSIYDQPKLHQRNIDNRESTTSRLPDIKLSTCPWLTSTEIENLEQHGIQGIRSLMTSNPVFVQAATGMSRSNYAGLMNRFLTCYYTPEDESSLSSSQSSFTSTGFKPLDQVLGGGLQASESIEFYGKSSTGKTQISMAIAAHFCCSTSPRTVIYFDLKHDFKATRFLSMCQGVNSVLNNIQIIRSSSLSEFLNDVEEAKSSIKNKSLDFFENVKLVVFDSVPMMIYPTVAEWTDWRKVENMVFETIKEFAKLNDGIITIFVNHATTPWITNNQKMHPQQSTDVQPKEMPALGQNWKDKPDIRVLCEADEKFDHVIHGKLIKCLRVGVPQTFDFFIPPASY